MYDLLDNASQCDEIWQRIINNSQKNIELIFEPNGSHYYSAINNRYNLVANIFQIVFNIDFQKHLKDSESFKNIMNQGEIDEIKHYKIKGLNLNRDFYFLFSKKKIFTPTEKKFLEYFSDQYNLDIIHE